MTEFLAALQALADLFGADRFREHSFCLSSDPIVIWSYDLLNLAIAWSYGAIALTFALNRNNVIQFIRFVYYKPHAIWIYALFIAFCGAGHASMSLTMHLGVYYLDLIVNYCTAGVSVTAAIATLWAFYGERSIPSVGDALARPRLERGE